MTYRYILLTKQVLTLILAHTLVQRCRSHSGKYRPFSLMQFFFPGQWMHHRVCGDLYFTTSPLSPMVAETVLSIISVFNTLLPTQTETMFFVLYWCIGVLSVSCFMLTVIRFRAEAAPRRLRTQSLYLTQVMREAGRANLSAANSSPVSRYGLFTRLSLHTNELFNNSVGQRNKLSAESCGNSSGTDEDLTSGSAVFVFTGSTQLRSAAGSSFYTPKGSSTGRNENFFPICMFAGKIQNLKGAEGQFLMFSLLNSTTSDVNKPNSLPFLSHCSSDCNSMYV